MSAKAVSILEHMLEDSRDILDFIKAVSSSQDLEKNRMCRKAITQSLLNLGENAKLLEKEVDLAESNVDWKGLKGLRDIAAHRYHTIDSDIIWNVAVNDVPEIDNFLRTQMRQFQQASGVVGILHEHGNPSMMPLEKEAWEMAAAEKHDAD